MPKEVVRQLTKKQAEIVSLIIDGASYEAVAEQCGVTINTVGNLMKRDDVRQMRYKAACDVLNGAAVRAAKLLAKQLDDENGWIAQNAARTILQWEKENREREDQSISVVFDGMTDPEKTQRIANTAVLDSDGNVT